MNMELWIVSLILIVFGDLIQPWTLWQSKTASFDPGSMSVRQAHAPAPVIIHTGMQNGESNADIKKGRPSGQPFLESDFFRSARTGFAICSAGCVQQQADQPGSWFPAVEFGASSFFSMQPGRGFRCPTDIMQRAVEPLQYEYRINRIRVYLQQRPGHWRNRFFPAQP
jgi:hypothetical protein